MNEQQTLYENYIIESSKYLINEELHRFLFFLFKHIFLHESKTKTSFDAIKKLISWIKIINEKMIIIKENFISTKYSKQNFRNIIKFVKSQNMLYSSDIIENILIIIFSIGFKTIKENTFAKYIYNNLHRIKQPDNTDLSDWFDSSKFKPGEFSSFKILLNEGPFMKNLENTQMTETQKNNVFYYFLILLNYDKNDYYEIKFKNKIKYYTDLYKENEKEKDKIDETYYITDKLAKEEEISHYSSINIEEYRDRKLNKTQNISINITRSFFISVYIYYQNRNSPLMKYIAKTEDERNLAIIPFSYDFSSAVIRTDFAGIIMASAKIEPRVYKIDFSKNILKEKGMAELSKILIFNKNMKIIDFHRAAIKSIFLNFLLYGLGLFDNYNVEELNISLNYIKEDSFDILGKILSHFKGLKTINLSMNKLGKGITYFLIVLKKLYRSNKIMLENLYLNDCKLDDSSFYELGRLLKSKFCKLKNLYLNRDNTPYNFNFLKKLKNNKSLTEIYFNNGNVGNKQTNDILRIISNTNLQSLYLYNNKITNFNNCLRIIYRTRLISKNKAKKEKIIKRTDSLLYNLDLSNNNIFHKNKIYIKLLDKITNETTLYCLDFSHILLGKDPNSCLEEKKETEYQKVVLQLRDKLNQQQQYYVEAIKNINSNEIEIEKLKQYENLELNEKIQKEIDTILLDKNAEFPVFLREKAKELRNENQLFFEGKNKNEIKEKLVKYMELKLKSKKLEKYKKDREQKKLIII